MPFTFLGMMFYDVFNNFQKCYISYLKSSFLWCGFKFYCWVSCDILKIFDETYNDMKKRVIFDISYAGL